MMSVLSIRSYSPVGASQQKVSVIVTSLLKNELLSDCLKSVFKQTHQNIECLVFLNNSRYQDALDWGVRFPRAKFFHFEHNVLYCKPQNFGIRMSEGDYILCLNDDVVLSPCFVEEALKGISLRPDIGILSGCLMRPDGKTFDSLGLAWSKSRKPIDRGYGKQSFKSHDQSCFIFGANGAAAFLRRAMLEDIKAIGEYFDERLGFFYEDFDLAWRAKLKGWRALYHPKALAFHKRGATSRINSAKSISLLKKFAISGLSQDLKIRLILNRYRTIVKNDNLFSFLIDFPWILFYEVRLLIYLILFDQKVLVEILSRLCRPKSS